MKGRGRDPRPYPCSACSCILRSPFQHSSTSLATPRGGFVSTLINSLRAPWLACAAAAAVSFSVSPSARTPITTEQAAPAAPQGGGQRGQSGTPPAAPQTPGGQAGRGGAGGLFPQTEPDDTEGFVPIFDGKTLSGWDGDPTFWRAENGVIVGETTPEKVVKVEQLSDLARRDRQGFRVEGRVPPRRHQQRHSVSKRRSCPTSASGC